MASSVSFLPTTTSMMEATLACSTAIGGGAGIAVAAAAADAAGASPGAEDCGAAVVGGGEWLKRHPRNAATARAQPATAHVANILIREEFLEVPRMLRGTSNS